MTKTIFAVQFIIEDTKPVEGWNSANDFLCNIQSHFFEEFPEYKVLSEQYSKVLPNEGVKHLSVTPTTQHIFTYEEEN